MAVFQAKERDNTWLQLTDAECGSSECSYTPSGTRPEEACPFAHPSKDLLENNPLTNGKIVSCHDFVFGLGHPGRRGCTRQNCRYFHPPAHLVEAVKNNGRINKKLRSHVLSSWQKVAGVPPTPATGYLTAAAPAQGGNLGLYSPAIPATLPVQQTHSLLPTPPYPPLVLPTPSQPGLPAQPEPPGTSLAPQLAATRKRNNTSEEASSQKVMRKEPLVQEPSLASQAAQPQPQQQQQQAAAAPLWVCPSQPMYIPWVPGAQYSPLQAQAQLQLQQQQQQQQQLLLQFSQQEALQQILLQPQQTQQGDSVAIKGLPVRY